MTDPIDLATAPWHTDEDDIAAVLLFNAIGHATGDDDAATASVTPDATLPPASAGGQPDTGTQHTTPDTGDTLSQPTQPTTTPAPAAPPAAPAPTAAPMVPPLVAPTTPPGQQPPAAGGATGQPGQNPATGTETGEDRGYPEHTPVSQMTPEQQAAYWRHYARRHEDALKGVGGLDGLRTLQETAGRYDQLVQASQTEQERAVSEARAAGRTEALQAAGSQLVEQWIKAAAAGRLPEDTVNTLLANLDRGKFFTQSHGVDTDKVYALVNSLIPPASAATAGTGGAPAVPPVQPGNPAQQSQPVTQPYPGAPATGGPDFGQGQPQTPRPSGLAAGREIARQRFGKAAADSQQTGPLATPRP